MLRNFFSYLKNLFIYFSIKKDLGYYEYLKSVALATLLIDNLKSNKYNQVFAYEYAFSTSIPFVKKNKISKGILFHTMLFAGPYEKPNYFKSMKSFLKFMMDDFDTLFASSKYCASAVKNVLGINKTFKVVFIGVDVNIYHPKNKDNGLRNSFNISEEKILILFLARMHPEMGLDFVLNNYKSILSINSNIHVLISGATGPLSNAAEKLSISNSRIHYLENFSFEEKPNLYAASDILIAPTLEEHACMGVSIKEAMASGLPVVASDSGGIPEAVENNKTGFIIPAKNKKLSINLFANKLSEIINNNELKLSMSKEGRERAVSLFSKEATWIKEDYISFTRKHLTKYKKGLILTALIIFLLFIFFIM